MAGIHEIVIVAAPFVAIGSYMYSPVWIRDFRLTESKKLLKQAFAMQTKVSTWPRVKRIPALNSGLAKIYESNNEVNERMPGLKGFVKFRDGSAIVDRHLMMKNEARKMHLEIVETERTEKALLLKYFQEDSTKELASPALLSGLVGILSKSQFQLSTKTMIDELTIVKDKIPNEEVRKNVEEFMHLLEAHVLLDEMLVENHNSAFYGRKTVNYAAAEFNAEDEKYKWKDKNWTHVDRK